MDDAFVAYVIGAKPRFTETTLGTIVSVPLARRALVIQAGRGQPEFLDRDAVGEALEAVRDQRLTRFDHGVYEVVVYGDALHQAGLVDGLAKILASPSGVIAVSAAGPGFWARAWARVQTWLRLWRGAKVAAADGPGDGPPPRGGAPAAAMPMAVPVRDPERERVA